MHPAARCSTLVPPATCTRSASSCQLRHLRALEHTHRPVEGAVRPGRPHRAPKIWGPHVAKAQHPFLLFPSNIFLGLDSQIPRPAASLVLVQFSIRCGLGPEGRLITNDQHNDSNHDSPSICSKKTPELTDRAQI
jgi:hypothetical protein